MKQAPALAKAVDLSFAAVQRVPAGKGDFARSHVQQPGFVERYQNIKPLKPLNRSTLCRLRRTIIYDSNINNSTINVEVEN